MKIIGGEDFILLLTDRRQVYSWGKNDIGQFGIGIIDENYHKPAKINFPLDIPIRYISAGENHAAAIDFEYNVYVWGSNYRGQLGLGDNVSRFSPTMVEYLTEKKVEKIYCGFDHTFALTQNGEVYSWGSNYNGILGIGNYNNVNTPTKLHFPDNIIIKNIYAGEYHSFAVDTCSNIYSWGCNYNYQLCNSNNTQHSSPSIANMLGDFNIDKIICLCGSTIILADNKLYSIGRGNFGELGLGITCTKEITLIAEGVEKVWGDWRTVFCKMTSGDLYAWGFNQNEELGIGNKINQKTPVKLNVYLDIKNINYNCDVIYAITTNGEIYTWGLNELVSEKYILAPTPFTYFIDNNIDIKTMNRTKSARKN